jgi:hypothetical protein
MLPEVMLMNESVVEAVQLQPAGAVTFTVPDPPAAAKF